jgi:hypothetical protein
LDWLKGEKVELTTTTMILSEEIRDLMRKRSGSTGEEE